MKILYVMRSVVDYGGNAQIIARLCAGGNSVEALFDPVWSNERPDTAARAGLEKTPGLTFGWSLRRKNRWELFLLVSRELLTYSSYLNRKGQSAFYKKRWEGYLRPPVRWMVRRFPPARWLVSTGLARWLLRSFERLAPSEASIIRWLKDNRPDVVVASPANIHFSPEVEYLKAARARGIPTVIPVFSWDNLTTKGLYPIVPDVVLAWNRTQSTEASLIHRVPGKHIVITGAPLFDRWLAAGTLGLGREAFCRKAGLDPEAPFSVYLGSSANIAADETWLVQELVDTLRRHPNPAMRNMNILVRPHPGHARHFQQVKDRLTVVWPPEGALPDTEERLGDFYNTLQHCVCTVGINNSAMLEAVINDRPCLTIITDRYKTTQMETGHFQSLLDFDMLEITRSAAECVERIETLWKGRDTRQAARRRFVEEFIRPRGIDRPAGAAAARAIELTALRKSAAAIDRELGNIA
jgi:hypothetical protein